MTLSRDEIIRMAQEFGAWPVHTGTNGVMHAFSDESLSRFVEIIHQAGVNAGLERAAKLSDQTAGNYSDFDRYERRAAGRLGSAIRALINKED